MDRTVTISLDEYLGLRELQDKWEQKLADIEAAIPKIRVYEINGGPWSKKEYETKNYTIAYENIEKATQKIITSALTKASDEVANIKNENYKLKENYASAPFLKRIKYVFTKSIE